jgi:Uma2 family endonuclease
MSALTKPMSIDEFVAWEERQKLLYEFDGFSARAMTGGTFARARIEANLLRALFNRMQGRPWAARGSELKIRNDTSLCYPDALITCSRIDLRSTFASDPVVIFEILSRSSARQDLGAKNAEYQTLPSPKRYVVLHQGLAAAEVFHRDAEGEWVRGFVSAPAALEMPEVGVSVPLSEIYEDIEFAA